MVEKFLETFAKMIADHPQKIRVEREDIDDSFCTITLFADENDTGKLIGKNGKMISSIKSVISGCKAKENRSYRINIQAQ
ncbi:MAG: KH domain-containing protein [Sulfurospirillum sp.]|nr:MAG: KH domain-containing protein [Sulfurospirillum sp.]